MGGADTRAGAGSIGAACSRSVAVHACSSIHVAIASRMASFTT
jgi:hypothetical protein